MPNRLAREITLDEINAYHVAGVVLLRGVLDLTTVNLLRACIDGGIEAISASPGGYDLTTAAAPESNEIDIPICTSSRAKYGLSAHLECITPSTKHSKTGEDKNDRGRFLLETALSARHDKFRRLIMRGAFPQIAGALLKATTVRLLDDQLYVKEPRTRLRTAFHRDADYFDLLGHDCCTLWISVDPVTLQTGALQYIRRSHIQPPDQAPEILSSQAALLSASERASVKFCDPDRYDTVHFDTEPGDVLVHHYRTIHGSGANQSRYQPRRAASIKYVGDDICVASRSPQAFQLGSQTSKGGSLSEDAYPIVWRRPASKIAA